MLTVVALGCGVGGVCAIELINGALLHAFTAGLEGLEGRVALQVSTGGAPFSQDVVAAVARVPGVALAVPVVSGTAFAADGSDEPLTVQGMELANKAALRLYQPEGDLPELDLRLFAPDAVVLTHTFAARRDLRVGDGIVLDTPAGRRTFTVRRLFDPQGVARLYGDAFAAMDLYAAQAVFTARGLINRVDIVVAPPDEIERVAAAVAAAVPGGLLVERPRQREAELRRVVRSFRMLLHGAGLVQLVVGFLIAFSGLSSTFDRRVWQLAVLRAVGVRVRVVWRELMKEGLLLGVAGLAMGIPFGFVGARLELPVIGRTVALNLNAVRPEAELTFQAWPLLLSGGLGLAVALLAAALPAWRGARVSVAEALRGRGLERPGMGPRWGWVVGGALAIGIGATLGVQWATGSAGWGVAASGLVAVGTALAARPLLWLAGPGLRRLARQRVGPTFGLAAANLARNPRRAALSVATLGVGLGSALSLWIVAESFQQSVIDNLAGIFGRADLVVRSSHLASGYSPAPISGDLLAALRELPGVMTVAAERSAGWYQGGGPISISAFDPATFAGGEPGPLALVGRRLPDVWAAVARGDAAIVSTNFARNLRTRVGDILAMETPSGPLRLRVAGVTTHFTSARGTIVMSRELYERFWHDGQITWVFVQTVPQAEVGAVRAAISRTLGRANGLQILSPGELVEYFAGRVRQAFVLVDILAGLVMLVVLVGMTDTLLAEVFDRTAELGILRAVGVRKRYPARLVLVEGVMLGTLGLGLAVAEGLVLGRLWVDAVLPSSLGWVVEFRTPYRQIVIGALLSGAVCLAAGLLPAWRAARLEPAVALRHE